MPNTIRHRIIDRHRTAMQRIDDLDLCLQLMDEMSGDRNPQLKAAIPAMLQLHESVREVWRKLRTIL